MKKTIEIPLPLYERLAKLAQGFERPADVIERLIDLLEQGQIDVCRESSENTEVKKTHRSPTPVRLHGKLDINFSPSDTTQFKAHLLRVKKAWVLLHRADGSKDLHEWNAFRFSDKSDVLGNLRSGYLRGWREKGIVRADIAINKSDISEQP